MTESKDLYVMRCTGMMCKSSLLIEVMAVFGRWGSKLPFQKPSEVFEGKSRKTADIRAPTLMTTVQMEENEMSPSASVSIVPSPTVRRSFENSGDN